MTDQLPDDVEDLRPAARFVYRELEHSADGKLTAQQLINWTGLDQSTVRRATTQLAERGVITQCWRDEDPRERVFALE